MSFMSRVIGRVRRRTRIDERRTVYPVGRDQFKYCEGDHCLLLQIELLSGTPERLLYPGTITEWLPPHEKETISEAKREEIAQAICAFLNATGESTEIFREPLQDAVRSQGENRSTNRIGRRGHPHFGDVIEIATDQGLAYAQYAHEEERFYGSLIRVLPGLLESRPSDLPSLVRGPEREPAS